MSARVRVEQAIARGDDVERIYRDQDVTPAFVDTVLAAMNAAVADTDVAINPLFRDTPTTGRAGTTLAPCGTHAAYARHQWRGETPCDDCATAERAYRAERARARRAAA